MATQKLVDTLVDKLTIGLEYDVDNLTDRQAWGSISFEAGRLDYDRIFALMGHLNQLPLEYLGDDTINNIVGAMDGVLETLTTIDKFSVEQGNPVQLRDQMLSQIKNQADSLFKVAAPWVPFLAYQKGDVAENIGKISGAVSDAKGILDGAKDYVDDAKIKVDGIVEDTRTAAAKAGAATFTKEFDKRAEALLDSAKTWLNTTIALAVVTIAVALYTYYSIDPNLTSAALWQRGISKVGLLVLLITSTLWSGRNYRALMHQSVANQHRATSLTTLQAFISAARDPNVKDAVVLEATKTIFGLGSTGFVDGSGADATSDTRLIEVTRAPVMAGSVMKSGDDAK